MRDLKAELLAEKRKGEESEKKHKKQKREEKKKVDILKQEITTLKAELEEARRIGKYINIYIYISCYIFILFCIYCYVNKRIKTIYLYIYRRRCSKGKRCNLRASKQRKRHRPQQN